MLQSNKKQCTNELLLHIFTGMSHLKEATWCLLPLLLTGKKTETKKKSYKAYTIAKTQSSYEETTRKWKHHFVLFRALVILLHLAAARSGLPPDQSWNWTLQQTTSKRSNHHYRSF